MLLLVHKLYKQSSSRAVAPTPNFYCFIFRRSWSYH